MNAYIIFNRKGLAALLSALLAIGFICCEVFAAGNNDENAKTNGDRLIFIENEGCNPVSTEPSVKTVTIPEKFSDVYKNYNRIQYEAGYDLSPYRGLKVTVYTYAVTPPDGYDGECVLNMIVYNNRVIGGDISSPALNGFMLPLKKRVKK